MDKRILDGVTEVCGKIMAGKADNVPYSFMGHEGMMLAKAVTGPGMRTDGGLPYTPRKSRA